MYKKEAKLLESYVYKVGLSKKANVGSKLKALVNHIRGIPPKPPVPPKPSVAKQIATGTGKGLGAAGMAGLGAAAAMDENALSELEMKIPSNITENIQHLSDKLTSMVESGQIDIANLDPNELKNMAINALNNSGYKETGQGMLDSVKSIVNAGKVDQ